MNLTVAVPEFSYLLYIHLNLMGLDCINHGLKKLLQVLMSLPIPCMCQFYTLVHMSGNKLCVSICLLIDF